MASRAVYRCKQDMVCGVNGQRLHLGEGDLVFDDHAVKPKGNPNFEEISEYVERTSTPYRRGVVIEEATADPGERRRVGRPRGTKNQPKEAPADPVVESVAPQAQEEGA